MRISDWSSDVGSSDREPSQARPAERGRGVAAGRPDPDVETAGQGRPGRSDDPGAIAASLGERRTDHLDRGPVAFAGDPHPRGDRRSPDRSEEHTSELQSLMRISYDVFCLKKKLSLATLVTYFIFITLTSFIVY